MPSSVICVVCSECESKYKCPKCLIRYCSLACFRSHSCQILSSDPKKGSSNQESLVDAQSSQPRTQKRSRDKGDIYQQLGIPLPEDFILRKEHIELLKSDPRIQSLISSPTLRKVLGVIHRCPNKSESFKVMERASQNHPEYFEFSQLVLDILDQDRLKPKS
jgi:hypothetical protein